jgi:hypothetical protein
VSIFEVYVERPQILRILSVKFFSVLFSFACGPDPVSQYKVWRKDGGLQQHYLDPVWSVGTHCSIGKDTAGILGATLISVATFSVPCFYSLLILMQTALLFL